MTKEFERLRVKGFDLCSTVTSGQLFAYDEPAPGEFLVVDGRQAFVVRQDGDVLSFLGTGREHLARFLDLSFDREAFARRMRKDAVAEHLHAHPAFRLVRQDLRQAILTFILTSNNNQKRIKGMVDRLRASHGEAIEHPDRGVVKAFPRRGTVGVDELERLGFGYRAAYYAATDRLVDERFLSALRRLPYADAKLRLMALPGVGPKVADCVLAYSELARGEAFPADVWVKRAIERWYAFTKPLTYKNIQDFAFKRFGKDAAYAQHHLFLAAQEHL